MKIKLFLFALLLASCSKAKICKETHESLQFNNNTAQFYFQFIHQTAPKEVKKPLYEWQPYGDIQNGTNMNKYRFKHICE